MSRVVYLTDLVSGCGSRSAICCWYLAIFRSLVFMIFSMLLAGLVSSKNVCSVWWCGQVCWNCSRWVVDSSETWEVITIVSGWGWNCFKSCNGLQNWVMVSGVYLPGFRAVEKTFRMCVVVGFGHKQRGHLGSVWILHLHRFRGVGRQSAPAFNMKLSWPAGRPAWILVQTLHPAPSTMMSLNLDCMARVSRWLFRY